MFIPNLFKLIIAKLNKLFNKDERTKFEKAMDALRFEWLETRTEFDFFSTEQVLAYYLKVLMLHRWSLLTIEEGEKVFRELVADMKRGIKLD